VLRDLFAVRETILDVKSDGVFDVSTASSYVSPWL
jgi:hypothetical protein